MEIGPDRVLRIHAVSTLCRKSVHRNIRISCAGGGEFDCKEQQDGMDISIPLGILGSCAFVSFSTDRAIKEFTLYLTLKSTPRVFVTENGSSTRVSIPIGGATTDANDTTEHSMILKYAVEVLFHISRSSVIGLVFPNECWDDVVSVLSDSSTLGVPLLITQLQSAPSQ
jgi:hypothetical protein